MPFQRGQGPGRWRASQRPGLSPERLRWRTFNSARTSVTSSKQPCDFRSTSDSEPCSMTPTTLLALGMDTPPRGAAARRESSCQELRYVHYCDEHLSMARRGLDRT